LNTGNLGAGVLFGISFFILSRSLNHEQLRYYLIISSLGIMIIFSSGLSPNSTLAPFPAWSITSLSFILPASFFTYDRAGFRNLLYCNRYNIERIFPQT